MIDSGRAVKCLRTRYKTTMAMSERRLAKRGRPRASSRRLHAPPAQDILVHAAKLFAKQGFAGTTTRQIAAAAGLRQPSLFHHYPTKTAMIHALCAAAVEAPLRLAEQLAQQTGDPAATLYRLLFGYIMHLCESPYDLSSLAQNPEMRLPEFRKWAAKRDRIREAVRDLVRAGQRRGQVVSGHVEITAQMLLMLCEAPLEWYRPGLGLAANEVATQLARFCLRGLLHNASELDAIVARAP
jgi:AcrR family transcriptional regulator